MAISSALGSAGAVPLGVVNSFAGSTAPSGYLLCFGQAVSRTEYSGLFNVLSTTYGVGDGSTTFNIPDLRGRVVAGEDDMGGTAASRLTSAVSGLNGLALGATGGNQIMHAHDHANSASFTGTAASHTHIQNAHNHMYAENHPFAGQGPNDIRVDKVSGTLNGIGFVSSEIAVNQNTSITPAGTVAMTNATFPPTAGGTSQNVQPTIILNYIIKAQ